MKKILSVLAFALWVFGGPVPARALDEAIDYDLALRGGTLYRGGLALSGPGDVGIRGDRIVAVGVAAGRARREIDVRGRIVAPGFIDLRNHTDEGFGWIGPLPLPSGGKEIRNFLTQGVTTIVTGNCGGGPDTPEEVADWLRQVDETPFGTNVIHLIPHGDLRRTVMGEAQAERADPAPTPAEIERMRTLLEASLREGAWGLSSGLEYDPGARASTDELVALASVAAQHGGGDRCRERRRSGRRGDGPRVRSGGLRDLFHPGRGRCASLHDA